MYEFEKLEIWGMSLDIVEQVRNLARTHILRKDRWLADQMQRAAMSLSLNIAEGKGSGSDKEFRRFLKIVLRSLYELIGCIRISTRLGLLKDEDCTKVLQLCDSFGARTNKLISVLSETIKGSRKASRKQRVANSQCGEVAEWLKAADC